MIFYVKSISSLNNIPEPNLVKILDSKNLQSNSKNDEKELEDEQVDKDMDNQFEQINKNLS